ncbi:MAG: glycosyltransferase family 4 protein [Chloroflexi bacterium]|nr:glycosyltransferase family 4 protein [Chloroflexota bacterium]
MLSKALVVGAYQRKCEYIAECDDVELTVLAPPSWRTSKTATMLERAHVKGYALDAVPIRFNGNFHLHYYPTLRQALVRTHPQVVHIDEEPYNTATYLALRTARAVGAKTVFFSWQNLLRRYPPPFRWMERYVLAHADAAIAGNNEAAGVLRAKGYRRAIHLIPQFGIDENVFHPDRSSGRLASRLAGRLAGRLANDLFFTIGYVGRLVKEKGVDLAIHALSGLPKMVRLAIIGTGDELSNLRALATSLGVVGRVQFTPGVPSTQMPSVYAQLDALVLPSRTQVNWKEQFGRVLIEAMACGVPVIGSTCGEIPNVIGDAGLTFHENDIEALRAQVIKLIEQPALREELSGRGRARVLAHYTMGRIAAETVDVYRSLM